MLSTLSLPHFNFPLKLSNMYMYHRRKNALYSTDQALRSSCLTAETFAYGYLVALWHIEIWQAAKVVLSN